MGLRVLRNLAVVDGKRNALKGEVQTRSPEVSGPSQCCYGPVKTQLTNPGFNGSVGQSIGF